MTPEQLKKLIHELSLANDKSTADAIEKHVNGKINRMQTCLDEHIVISTKFMNDMLPVKDGLQFIQTFNRFLKWIGVPSLVALISWIFFNK